MHPRQAGSSQSTGLPDAPLTPAGSGPKIQANVCMTSPPLKIPLRFYRLCRVCFQSLPPDSLIRSQSPRAPHSAWSRLTAQHVRGDVAEGSILFPTRWAASRRLGVAARFVVAPVSVFELFHFPTAAGPQAAPTVFFPTVFFIESSFRNPFPLGPPPLSSVVLCPHHRGHGLENQ